MSTEKFGQDEWVSVVEARRRSQWGPLARLGQVHPLIFMAVLVALAATVPMFTSNQYIIRVMGNVCLFGLLALGLNVTVGYAGLLDLGYVAFYGLGGYSYALLSSEQFGIHLPTWITIPLVVLLTMFFGFLLGLPSLRLTGDYLAIVTLGFAQIFVLLALSLNRVNLPWSDELINLTGGPNGITNLDPIRLFGFTFTSVTDYFYLLLLSLFLIVVVLYHIDQSRVGRAWRALREDALAAEAMGMPVRRLKLLAFAIGAAIAGLSGSIFAAWQTAVFPVNFDVILLITLYAMVVLGGVGSLRGAVSGALILAVVPELLRSPDTARMLFYGALLLMLVFLMRPRWRAPLFLLLLFLFGVVVSAVVNLLWPNAIGMTVVYAPTPLGRAVQDWLILPRDHVLIGNIAFFVVVPLLMVVSRMHEGVARFLLWIPTLYLLIFVWETRLAAEPSITRLLFFGALLVLLMTYRPQGLFGQPRVEVV